MVKTFDGIYLSVVDKNGRCRLPDNLRNALGESEEIEFAASLGMGNCLTMCDPELMDKRAEEFISSDLTDTDKVAFVRNFFPHRTIIKLDSKGRFIIPKALREAVNIQLEKEVYILGAGFWIEIWFKDNYEAARVKEIEDYSNAAVKFYASLGRQNTPKNLENSGRDDESSKRKTPAGNGPANNRGF